jgi:hypothetical protein
MAADSTGANDVAQALMSAAPGFVSPLWLPASEYVRHQKP